MKDDLKFLTFYLRNVTCSSKAVQKGLLFYREGWTETGELNFTNEKVQRFLVQSGLSFCVMNGQAGVFFLKNL